MAAAKAHVWKTSDGRLVLDDDPDAATLAYAPGDEVRPADAAAVAALFGEEEKPSPSESTVRTVKQSAPTEDKAAKRGGDKSK